MKLALCLVPICAGVALATTRGEDVSVEGAFWATAGLLAAAAYQVLVKRQQAALEVTISLKTIKGNIMHVLKAMYEAMVSFG